MFFQEDVSEATETIDDDDVLDVMAEDENIDDEDDEDKHEDVEEEREVSKPFK